jgi:hypothetical protein
LLTAQVGLLFSLGWLAVHTGLSTSREPALTRRLGGAGDFID